VATDPEQARTIAERVARRVKGGGAAASTKSTSRSSSKNGSPVGEELSAIRAGLHDLEQKLERIESKIVQAETVPSSKTRARVIDFVSSSPPAAASSSIGASPVTSEERPPERSSEFIPATERSSEFIPATERSSEFIPATHSPWLRDFNATVAHPSQERFGVEEATVTELVEFFESEKKCAMEPGGKPCDHCAMCSSRGF
jgi:hypothetical protein